MKKYQLLIVSFVVFVLFSCTPYNSDRENLQLIQGKWMLVDVNDLVYDTVFVDYEKEITYLFFEGNECTELMQDLNDTTHFNFQIRDYNLSLLKDNMLISIFSITTLTKDSLVLSTDKSHRKYKKIEQ